MTKGVRLASGVFAAGDDRLAGRHAERAAHEVEILHGDGDRRAFELAEGDRHGVRACRSWREYSFSLST